VNLQYLSFFTQKQITLNRKNSHLMSYNRGYYGKGKGKGQGKGAPNYRMDMADESINLHSATNYCKFFVTGNCTAGASCRHRHDVKRLVELQKAHSGVINAVILADGLIWTAGSDTALRSWRPFPGASGLEIQPAGPPVECGEPVTSLLWDPSRKALICGLQSGTIRVFTREPVGQLDLHGHTGAIHSMVIFQNILISASWDGSVRTWQGEQLSAGMVIEAARIPVGSIRMVKVFGGRMWLGGVLGLCAIDLQSLQVCLTIGCDSPVMSLVEFPPTDSVIIGTLSGSIKVVQQQSGLLTQSIDLGQTDSGNHHATGRGKGHSNYSWTNKSQSMGIVTLEGMMLGNSGKPVIVVGDQSGSCKVLELPSLQNIGQWFAHSKGSDIRNILNTNENNIFITTASDGCLAIWQWQI
jgi:WD40 repeat protein